jgi:hypothetical protein
MDVTAAWMRQCGKWTTQLLPLRSASAGPSAAQLRSCPGTNLQLRMWNDGKLQRCAAHVYSVSALKLA